MSAHRSRALLALTLLAALPRCAKDPTGIYVTLTVESALANCLERVEFRVFNPANSTGMPEDSETRMTTQLPASGSTFLVLPKANNHAQTVRIEVGGYRATGRCPALPDIMLMPGMPDPGWVSDRAVVTFRPDTTIDVPMTLRAACAGLMCMELEEHCTGAMMMPGGTRRDPMCTSATVSGATHNY